MLYSIPHTHACTHTHTHTHTHARTRTRIRTRTRTHTHTHTDNNTPPKHTAQNQWLRENTIDVHGNLLFCRDCLATCFGLHGSRIQRQRQIKQCQKDQPIVEMTKEEVEKRLVDHVLWDDEDGEQTTFATWWKSVEIRHHRSAVPT